MMTTIAFAVIYSLVGLFIWWLLLGVVMRMVLSPLAGWQSHELLIGLMCAAGVVAGTALRMYLLSYFLAGMVAFAASEFPMHAIFGIRAVQGAQAHFAVMIAGVLGVVALVLLRDRFVAPVAIAAAAVIGFVLAEAVIHVAFGRHPYRDGVTHAAVALAAVLGALLAVPLKGAAVDSAVIRAMASAGA